MPERIAGGILAGLGLLFFLRVIGVLMDVLTSQAPIAETELALHVSDFLSCCDLHPGSDLLCALWAVCARRGVRSHLVAGVARRVERNWGVF